MSGKCFGVEEIIHVRDGEFFAWDIKRHAVGFACCDDDAVKLRGEVDGILNGGIETEFYAVVIGDEVPVADEDVVRESLGRDHVEGAADDGA